jgi:hypothetical protein
MPTVVVRYETKPDRADENQQLIEKVFAELAERKPEGLRYATFRLADGVSFVHIATIETADGSNPLEQVAAFATFQEEIAQRCAVLPAVQPATPIGNYGFGGLGAT